jgi:hypothetical protein
MRVCLCFVVGVVVVRSRIEVGLDVEREIEWGRSMGGIMYVQGVKARGFREGCVPQLFDGDELGVQSQCAAIDFIQGHVHPQILDIPRRFHLR